MPRIGDGATPPAGPEVLKANGLALRKGQARARRLRAHPHEAVL